MFSYTKILPLALLLSIPVIAMHQDKSVVPASALESTLLASNNLTAAVEEADDLQKQIDALQERKKVAVANKNTFADQLETKYKAKCDEICGLDTLKLDAEKKVKEAEKAKISALEDLNAEYITTKEALEAKLHEEEVKFGKNKSAKEREHDTIITALAKIKTQRETEIVDASKKRDALHDQLTKARATGTQPTTGLLGLGFLGL